MRAPEPESTAKTCSVELRPAICSDRDEFLAEAAMAERIVVELDVPGPAERGRLATFIQSAIERQLAERGAPPSGVGLAAGINASFCDQLYRARLLGAEGFALAFSDLEGVADRSGILDADDSAAVRWWLKATESHPLQLLLPRNASGLRVYGAPTPLGEWLPGAGMQHKAVIEWETDEPVDASLSASTDAMSLAALLRDDPIPGESLRSEPVDSVPAESEAVNDDALRSEAMNDDAPRFESVSVEPSGAERVGAEPVATEGAAVDPIRIEPQVDNEAFLEIAPSFALASGMDFKIAFANATHSGSTPAPEEIAESNPIEPASAPFGPPTAPSPVEARTVEARTVEARTVEARTVEARTVEARTVEARTVEARTVEARTVEARTVEARTVEAPQAPSASKSVRERDLERQVEGWMRELGSAQGPKPLSVIERLFVSAYVPLCHALAEGVRMPEARDVMLEWSHSFETSYRPAFDALKKKGRRPTMVLDVPDVAARLGRLHSARHVQLLLIDGMRYDVGQAMRQSLKTLTAGNAACAEQLLLWSGLPTTTGAQLELIGRGPGGMADFTGSLDDAALVSHGPEARLIRRLRTGRHEMFKLDIVEDQIVGSGPKLLTRIADLAEETAQLVATHMASLPPRTLLMIFGDHGFQMEQRGNATRAATQGGATPEEVFVPAYAWITENVH